MSAFIVSHDHIDALMSYALAHRLSYYVPAVPPAVGGASITVTSFNVTEVGRILLDENERSVRARYSDYAPGELPGTIGEESGGYTFRQFPALPAVHVLKACQCFDYQACETDDYEATLAHTIVNAIRSAAVRDLPGYEKAPWEINRKREKTA